MKIAVTGGLGFIGSNYIRYVLHNYPNDTVINIDKETYASNRAYVKEYEGDSRYDFKRVDICSSSEAMKCLSDADAIVNFAAESHVDNSILDISPFVSTNYMGTVNLLNIARERSIRFNQVSTDEVFGSLPLNSSIRFTENTCYNPRNPYSATKAAADHTVMAYYNTYSVPATITHSSNNYGPHQHREKLIPKTILNLNANLKVPIYGNGLQIRDWIYVEDNCRAIDIVLRHGKAGQRYLIGSGNEMPNVALVEKIIELMGKQQDMMEHVNDRPGHDMRYSSDFSKIKRELGWAPKISLNEGLKLTIGHYLNNLDLYT